MMGNFTLKFHSKLRLGLGLIVVLVWSQIVGDPCLRNTQLSGGTSYFLNGQQGSAGSGLNFTIQSDNTAVGSITIYGVGAAFRSDWDTGEFLASVGLQWEKNSSRHGGLYAEYGSVVAEFCYTRSEKGKAEGYSYVGVHGWSRNPLVEYYIVDDWYHGEGNVETERLDFCDTEQPECQQGIIDIDGGIYKIYKRVRNGSPKIDDTASSYTQYFSVRQLIRQCGIVSVSEHFRKWESLGMELGSMCDAKLFVKSGGTGTGWIDYSYGLVRDHVTINAAETTSEASLQTQMVQHSFAPLEEKKEEVIVEELDKDLADNETGDDDDEKKEVNTSAIVGFELLGIVVVFIVIIVIAVVMGKVSS